MSFSANLDHLVSANSNGLLSTHPSWARVRLSDIAAILNGAPFDSERFSRDRGEPLLRIRDVTNATTDTKYDGPFDPQYWVEPGDLVVGMDGDFKCALWRGPRALLNQRVCRLTPDERFYLRRFLVLALPGYLSSINDHTSSITVKHLSSRTVGEIPLPLPPLAEQRRIVEALETHFTRLDAAVATLERARANLNRYRTSVIQATVGNRLIFEADDRGSTGWRMSSIGEIAVVGTGATPKRGTPKYYDDGDIPWVTSGALNDRVVATASEFVTEAALDETNLTVYPPGTLLVAMYGEGKTRGKCATLGIAAATNQAIAAITLRPEFVAYRSWVRLVLEAQYSAMRRMASGGVQPNLNLSLVRSVAVPLPPEAQALALVVEVERRLSLIEAAERLLSTNEARVTRLRQTLLRTAFEGRLVPQDPRDEPASVLLDRIRDERAVTAATPKKKSARSRR